MLKSKDINLLQRIAERECAPMYVVGEATGDYRLVFQHTQKEVQPIDLELENLFGNPPKTVMTDCTVEENFKDVEISL